MIFEYAGLIGKNFGLDAEFVVHMAVVMLSGLTLTGVGYAVKGVWGALAALGLGILGYLYWKQMWPF